MTAPNMRELSEHAHRYLRGKERVTIDALASDFGIDPQDLKARRDRMCSAGRRLEARLSAERVSGCVHDDSYCRSSLCVLRSFSVC